MQVECNGLFVSFRIHIDVPGPRNANVVLQRLLLGVDEEKGQIACGLVDTIGNYFTCFSYVELLLNHIIGSYTFAKTLEYKAKHNLNSGKDVTVIPPNEYQQRFINAIDSYFYACPGS